jgi:hypothetical protein
LARTYKNSLNIKVLVPTEKISREDQIEKDLLRLLSHISIKGTKLGKSKDNKCHCTYKALNKENNKVFEKSKILGKSKIKDKIKSSTK